MFGNDRRRQRRRRVAAVGAAGIAVKKHHDEKQADEEFTADPASPRHNPELDPSSRVIVYCRSGTRAELAGATLKELGFQRVENLDGGFAAWAEAGLPAEEHHADL